MAESGGTVDAQQQAALAALARRLDARGLEFVLGGSGMLWARGLTEDVGDLDLFFDPGAHDTLRDAAGEWWAGSRQGGDGIWLTDWLATLVVDGVEIDAVGGFAFRFEGHDLWLPLRAEGSVEVGGTRVPLADPALWWVAYLAYKPAKAALLEQVVTPEQRAAVREELGLTA